jgi:hypothetical protein
MLKLKKNYIYKTVFIFLILLLSNCSNPHYENPTEACKAYVKSFNDRDLEGLRSLSMENKSDLAINKIFEMWENLNSTVTIKSLNESRKTDLIINIDLVLQYEMTVEGQRINEEESVEFILKKENNEWKVEKGLL